MKLEAIDAYEILLHKQIEDLNSEAFLLRHKKTGARVVAVSNDEENKVFQIGFRTPPENSTGVAHIIEHSVLCGSDKFPAKDPFMVLEKSSLNTFLNAMTYPDKTVYPVASCNDKDFQNLMDVYLDAVFHPNIYREKKIFMQEGWHYECEAPDKELTVNGVVYNEMKGAFSSADDILYRQIMNSLYPDNTYGFESGGDPVVIPELSYEEFLNFHSRYYHPSNSYIYLFGNMDMAEKLQFIDEEYLSKYDNQPIDSVIPLQKAFEEPKRVRESYSISAGESEKNNTYLAYSVSIADSLDTKLYIAFQILDYVLCSSQGAPVKEALIKKGIGTEVYSFYENGIRQPYFSFIAKNANESDLEEFVKTIDETLGSLAEKGIDEKALLAGINCFEFRHREADFGNYPKGLMYGLQMYDSWLYDEMMPFIHVEANGTYAFLKENVKTGFFEECIKKYLLNNKHKSYLVLVPEKGKTAKEEKELAKKCAEYKNSLSKEEIEQIVADTKALKAYQEEPDSEEVLAKIPTLSISDIKKEPEPLTNEVRELLGRTFLYHDVFTNGIGYLRMAFSMDELPGRFYPYLGLFKSVLGGVDTEKHSYSELEHEEHILTGGINMSICTYTSFKNHKKYTTTVEVKTKVLYENIGKTFDFFTDVLLHSKFDDKERLKEIFEEMLSRMESDLISNGHVTAVNRAESYFSEAAQIGEMVGGVPAYYQLLDILDHFEERIEGIQAILQEMVSYVFRQDNLMFDLTAEEAGVKCMEEEAYRFFDQLSNREIDKEHFVPELKKANEGFTCAAQVQYVCRAGNFIDRGVEYSGAFRVMKSILGREFLWNQVRVKNGAYGCMCGFRRSGDSFFVSYRDPKCRETNAIFESTVEYLENLELTQEEIEKFIIGTIADMDIPLTPSTRGTRSFSAYLSECEYEDIQKERSQVLETTLEQLRATAKGVKAFLEEDCIVAVGNEDKLAECKDLFKELKPLIVSGEEYEEDFDDE